MPVDLPPDSTSHEIVIEQIIKNIDSKASPGTDEFNGEMISDKTWTKGNLITIISNKWAVFVKRGPENFIYFDVKPYGSLDGAAKNSKPMGDDDILEIIAQILKNPGLYKNTTQEHAQQDYQKDIPKYFGGE